MSVKDPTTNLKQYTRILKNAAPYEFEEFMMAFSEYLGAKYIAVVDSFPENVFYAQGMARECRAILQILLECDK